MRRAVFNTSGNYNHRLAPRTKKETHRNASRVSTALAQKRFSLNYKTDEAMEKRIENSEAFDGPFLREIREYKKVSIDRLAEMTKVAETYLVYLEEQAYDKLPAPAYVRGFAYQYAKCLKLNPDLVADSYIARLKDFLRNKEEN